MNAVTDWTLDELDWAPWLAPVALETASEAQREALKITPSNKGVSAYSLTLAHDPESLEHRSPLYNAIMFGPKGLPRADRELGALIASRINGCVYCASVHARRFAGLTKDEETVARIYKEGVDIAFEARRAAIVAYAAKLTKNPAAIDASDLPPLKAAGLSELEILDLTHAVAMFAWANRLMQTLGEPVRPPL